VARRAQRSIDRSPAGKVRRQLTPAEGSHESGIVAQLAQRFPVVRDTVRTAVRRGDHHRDPFALDAAQASALEHHRLVEIEVRSQSARVERLRLVNVRDAVAGRADGAVDAAQLALGFLGRHGGDPGHQLFQSRKRVRSSSITWEGTDSGCSIPRVRTESFICLRYRRQ
jgi:hypothetical protein